MTGKRQFFFYSLLLAPSLFVPYGVHANEKILSLDLCTDWMLATYARPSQVLALSPLLRKQPLEWIGDNWATHDGSLEMIMDLKPDLVITGEYNAMILRQRLQELGVKVEILALPKNLVQVTEYENRLLSLIGHPGKNTAHQSAPVAEKAKIDSEKDKPRLLLLGANGIGTGRSTFEDDILGAAGWDNYLQETGYINLDLEKITIDPPDAILWSVPNSTALSNLFAKHPALRKAIPDDRWLTTTSWKWRCPGPWTRDLINDLQASLPAMNQQ